MTFSIASTSIEPDAPIPSTFVRDGGNRSPEISWSDVPHGTAELALICEDPDAPRDEPWVHWVAYHIPPGAAHLPEGLPKKAHVEEEITQGRNTWGHVGYDGPQPPPGHGTHHYNFVVYALDERLPLDAGADVKKLKKAMQGHVLAEARLVGTYEA